MSRTARILVASAVTAAVLGAVAAIVVSLFQALGSWAPMVLAVLVAGMWILPRWLPPLLDPLEPAAWVGYLGRLWRWALREPASVVREHW